MTEHEAIILAAHGAGVDSDANALVESMTANLSQRFPGAVISSAFRLGIPGFDDCLDDLAPHIERVTVVPFMTSAGWFTRMLLPRELARNRRCVLDVKVTPPIGVHPSVQRSVADRAIESVRSGNAEIEHEVIVVGHGTRRSQHSGDSALNVASRIRAGLPGRRIRVAFLDQAPLLEDLAHSVRNRPVTLVSWLIGGGPHERADVPERLGIRPNEIDERGLARRSGGDVTFLPGVGAEPAVVDAISDLVTNTRRRTLVRLGTRGSRMAWWQARTAASIIGATGRSTVAVEVPTRGDADLTRSIDSFDSDGPFTDELQEALAGRKIDIGVHSFKDLPYRSAPGIAVAGVLRRGAMEEALVSRDGRRLAALPSGSVIGASSLRRAAQLRRLRPDLRLAVMRGPVDARVEQVRKGRFEGAILALAGLERLGLEGAVSEILPLAQFLPEAAQGVIALEARTDDAEMRTLIELVSHRPTHRAAIAERTFAAAIEGREPWVAAALADTRGEQITLHARVLSRDGAVCEDAVVRGEEPERVGRDAASMLLERIAATTGSFVGGHA